MPIGRHLNRKGFISDHGVLLRIYSTVHQASTFLCLYLKPSLFLGLIRDPVCLFYHCNHTPSQRPINQSIHLSSIGINFFLSKMAAAAEQKNPPTNEMLANHEIAWRTIEQHNTPIAIFDQSELTLLRHFVLDTSETNQAQVLENACRGNMYDGPDVVGDEDVGKKASEKGSLAGYMVARYGKTDRNTFDEKEIEALKEWFANGGGQE